MALLRGCGCARKRVWADRLATQRSCELRRARRIPSWVAPQAFDLRHIQAVVTTRTRMHRRGSFAWLRLRAETGMGRPLGHPAVVSTSARSPDTIWRDIHTLTCCTIKETGAVVTVLFLLQPKQELVDGELPGTVTTFHVSVRVQFSGDGTKRRHNGGMGHPDHQRTPSVGFELL